MSQENEPTAFESRTREVLEDSAGRLDGRTQSRLTQARHAALARLDQPARQAWRSWLPAGAATAAAVLAVVVWTGPGRDAGTQMAAGITTGANGGSAFEDIDLLVDAPDFVSDADDLEFYEWAAGEVES